MQSSLFSPVASGRTVSPRGPVGRPRGPAPLRIVHVVDGSGSPRRGGGRMVISGRMADVCAEIDRLAALEAH